MKKIILLSCFILLTACSKNKIINIEESNNYQWQKYMNEDEFQQLKKGQSYMEVVEIAGGEGKPLKNGQYVWGDELFMTHAYEITFKNDKLVKKEIIELRGTSTRDIIEIKKEPAKRESK